MLRRLHPDQPETFAFTPANQKWAETQITKYPEGRQASAIIPLLWRAQEQEGWLSRPAIEHVSDMLGLAHIRGLEVATFYFMFQLQPVGSVANIQVCGTTTCMVCGAEDLIAVCKEKIADKPHTLSADGKFSWEEVECLGACSNAPMAQIGKDFYEDLTNERLGEIIDELAAGQVPTPGPQNGRYASEALGGATNLKDYEKSRAAQNASVALATSIGDTVKRIDGAEVPLTAPWQGKAGGKSASTPPSKKAAAKAKTDARADGTGAAQTGKRKGRPKTGAVAPKPKTSGKTPAEAAAKPASSAAKKPVKAPAKASSEIKVSKKPVVAAKGPGKKPRTLKVPRKAGADDLKWIKGVGPKLESTLNGLGFFHFDQVAKWGPQEVAWVDQNLEGFKGRVSRDNWVVQAQRLARGELTEFAARAQKKGR